jgi:hopene-associated glycosyltransferase HpnB
MLWIFLSAAPALIWMLILLLPWRSWGTREYLEARSEAAETGNQTESLQSEPVTVLIPARNEATALQRTLPAVLDNQGVPVTIVLVNDRSTDNTAAIVQDASNRSLLLVDGEPRPEGWTGKLWALEQGLHHVRTDLTLCLDADIVLKPGTIAALVRKMRADGLQMVSLMAHLRMVSFWERLLIPAFVYFFKLLYPFRLCNSDSRKYAAAAGGCILIQTRVLREIGGFRAWRDNLIDDCAMARQVKRYGHRTWIGLTHAAVSIRAYDSLASIWNMVARTAFYQLRYSVWLLILTTLTMGIAFWVPPAGLFYTGTPVRLFSAVALAAMVATYIPVLRFYGRSPVWSLFLPIISLMYVAMTWTSALRYWSGKGAVWKNRTY